MRYRTALGVSPLVERSSVTHVYVCINWGYEVVFERRARDWRERRAKELLAAQASVMQKRDEELSALRVRREDGPPNHLASSAFGSDDLEACCHMLQSPNVRSLSLPAESVISSTSPEAPSVMQQRVIEDFAATLPHLRKMKLSWWCQRVCRHREEFQDCAFSVGEPDAETVYLCLLAKQSPQAATFLQLRREPLLLMSGSVSVCMEYEAFPADRAEYSCFPPVFMTDQEVPVAEDDDLFVHSRVRFEGARAATNTAAVPLERFIAAFPKVAPPRQKQAGGHRRRTMPADERAALLAAYPWLADDDLPADLVRRKASSRKAPSHRQAKATEHNPDEDIPSAAPPVEDALPEIAEEPEHVPEVFDDAILAEIRDQLAWEDSDESYFFFHILGGAWTLKNKGVHADGAGGYARQGAPTGWCKRYGWPRQASFMFNKYSRDSAVQLAKEYCRRSHHYMMLFIQSGTDNFVYTPEVLQSYQEGSEWLDWLCSLGDGDPAFKRGLALRTMTFRSPEGVVGASLDAVGTAASSSQVGV